MHWIRVTPLAPHINSFHTSNTDSNYIFGQNGFDSRCCCCCCCCHHIIYLNWMLFVLNFRALRIFYYIWWQIKQTDNPICGLNALHIAHRLHNHTFYILDCSTCCTYVGRFTYLLLACALFYSIQNDKYAMLNCILLCAWYPMLHDDRCLHNICYVYNVAFGLLIIIHL